MKITVETRGNSDYIIIFRKLVDTILQTTSESTSTVAESAVKCEANQVMDENPLNFTDTAKLLGIKRKDMMNFLESHGYIRRNDEGKPYALDNYVQQGLFRNAHYHSHNGHHGIQTRITPKGIAFIAKLLEAEKLK